MNGLQVFVYLNLLCLLACAQSSDSKNLMDKHANNQTAFLKKYPDFKAAFEEKIHGLYKEYYLQGDFIIGIVNEEGLAYSFALNREMIEGMPSSLNNDSPIYLASHSKAFMGTLLKILEQEGLVDLNKSLHDYLPEIDFGKELDTRKITVRQLLNHTHGIGANAYVWKTAFLGYEDKAELIRAINASERFDPSHQFRYSNTGPNIASLIVEKVTGNSWKEEMKKRIFQPLNMDRSSSNVSDYDLEEIRPSLSVNKDHQVYQKGFYKKDNTMAAAGGTISTLNDLAKWLKFNINQETTIVKSKDAFQELHDATTSQNREFFTYKRHGYSLSWDLASYQDLELLTRFGSYSGISFQASFCPEKKIGIISFSNEQRAGTLPYLAANYIYNLLTKRSDAEEIFEEEKERFTSFYDRMNEEPYPLEENKLLSSRENDRLQGHYYNELGWPDILISKDETGYQMQWGAINGMVYKTGSGERPYVGWLGPMMRSFQVEGDSLFTGSLRYVKKE